MKITLTQTAKWNSRLTNPYRTRYAEAGGRYFRVSAQTLNSLWDIEEINADGTDQLDGYFDYAFTLAEARNRIAEAVAE